MYNLKNLLFSELTKNQKSSLFAFLKGLTSKHKEKSSEDILDIFIEDEYYYFKQNNPHFEWIIDEFENDQFLDELKKYILECKRHYDFKEAQRPFMEKQREIAKEQRKKSQEFFMSKQDPTLKQLYYYEKLCKKYNLPQNSTQGLSRLDLKKMIGQILDDSEQID